MNQVKGNGASQSLFNHSRPNNPNRSKFDLSRIVNFSLDTGMIVPFECIPTLPDDEFHINLKMALDTLPLIQSSLTNYKVKIHYYYCKNRDLWKGWNTFITKGRSGNINLSIPKVNLNEKLCDASLYCLGSNSSKYLAGCYYPVGQHSLASFLGVVPYVSGLYNLTVDSSGYHTANLEKSYLPYTFKATGEGNIGSNGLTVYNDAISTGFGNYPYVNALPFVAYQQIVKYNYVPQNLLQDNKALFPDEGDIDWLLPYTVENANFIDGSNKTSSDVVNYSGIYSSSETKVDTRLLRYGLYDDDYFTTGLPWLQRGDLNGLDLAFSASVKTDLTLPTGNVNVDWFDSNSLTNNLGTAGLRLYQMGNDSGQTYADRSAFFVDGSPNPSKYDNGTMYNRFLGFDKSSVLSGLSASSSLQSTGVAFTANMLRELLALSVWQERNARVDGSYNRMIFQHWQVDPHSEEHVPTYIGGTVEYLNFSTILQNSQSTSDSPLGSTAGYGSCSGQSEICHYKCSDYGYIIGVMQIIPNTTYQQGVEHFLSCENTFNDFVQPEFEGLSPQNILNKEIYISGTDTDNGLFAYQERYTYLKVRQNVNRGLFQCKPDKDILFGAFTQARWFNELPKLSYQFVCCSPDNVRRDWLAYPVYPAFRCQLLSDVFVVRSLAYNSTPNTFGF